MSTVDLSQFRETAENNISPSTKSCLSEGESYWIHGDPVKAEEGLIAIRMQDDFVVTVDESDVLECVQHGAKFYIRIKRGSNVVSKLEFTRAFEPTSQEKRCKCENPESMTTHHVQNPSGGIGAGTPPIVIDCIQCRYEWRFARCRVPFSRKVVYCLVMYLVCTDVCETISA